MDDRIAVGCSERNVRRKECIWSIAVLTIAAWLYFWTATSGGYPPTSKLQHDDLYNRLSDAFLAGRLSFLETPDPRFESLSDPWDPAQNASIPHLHDVSYYHGRYYLYFGAAPALILLAPWKAVTGTYLGENVAGAIFAWFGVASSVALVLVLRRRHFPALKGWIGGLCLVVVAFGNFALPMLRRPVFYELSIACAFAFAMTALLCVALCVGEKATHRRRWLFLAGLAFGITLASRPNYFFGIVILVVPFLPAWKAWRAKRPFDRKVLTRELTAVGLPLIAMGLLIAGYNYSRFGDFLEFGNHYQLSGMHPRLQAPVTVDFVPTNFWFYLLAPAQWSSYFPFVQVIHIPWFSLPKGYSGEEDMFGILTNMPFFWMAFMAFPFWKDTTIQAGRQLRDLAGGILIMVGVNALVLFRLNGANNRYLVDLLPPLLVVACLGVFWAESSILNPWKRAGARIFWILALSFTVMINVLVSIAHNELYRTNNPASYGRLAHFFNHVSVWLGQTSNDKTGPLHLKVRFPRDKSAQLEPLVVTGLSFRADFIYVYYTDSDSIQFGFEHTSYGGDLTKPAVDVDYGKEHVLDIEMGSLYPPVDHPYYDGMPPGKIARLKHTLSVRLDGQEVLGGVYDFYDSSPGDVSVGLNPVSEAFGRRFTGLILESGRESPAHD